MAVCNYIEIVEQSVNHYRLVRKLGSGGMGEVYLAEDTRLKRNVALKFLPDHLSKDPEFKSRFEHEAQAVAALDHPNIISIHELGEHNGRLYIAMQYLDGRTLQEMLDTEEIQLKEALKIVEQICSGLAKAHEEGVIHRDIKPANIFVTSEGVVKILDFGLAKSRRSTTQTKTGTTVGTLHYESPEQCRGEKVDRRSDIFSVGVLLYQLITGRLPFTGDYDAAVVYAISHETPEPLARYKSNIPEALQNIIDKALAKEPDERFQHIDDLLVDLTLTSGEAKSPTRKSKTRLAPILIVLFVTFVTYLLYSQMTQQNTTEDASESHRVLLAVLPFENLGAPEDEYFADGITDEISSRLTGIKELGIIAPSSSNQYKGTNKSIRQISSELGVEYIIDGTIRWQNENNGVDLIRITPRLIQAQDATQLWAENYDRSFSEIFDIQTDIANQIIAQLQVLLPDVNYSHLKQNPSVDVEAYNFYLRGRHFLLNSDNTKQSVIKSIDMLSNALNIDSQYVEAHTLLANAYFTLYYQWGKSNDNLRTGKRHLDHALQISPNNIYALRALGFYHYLKKEFDSALVVMQQVRSMTGQIGARGLESAILFARGEFNRAIELDVKSVELDPRNSGKAFNLGWRLMALRRYDEADRYLGLSLAINPDQLGKVDHTAWLEFLWKGDFYSALEIIRGLPEESEWFEDTKYMTVRLMMCAGKYDDALEVVKGASERVSAHRWSKDYLPPKRFLEGFIYWVKGDYQAASNSFSSVIEVLQNDLDKNPENSRNRSYLGVAYAGVGLKDEAIREGIKATEVAPISKSAILGVIPIFDLILIYMMAGEFDKALDRIEQLLNLPCDEFSPATMKIDPLWAPLRDHPRFQELIAKYSVK